MVKEIIATKRTDDYHACLKDNPEIWGCGNSLKAAIGDLIMSHDNTFDIDIDEGYINPKSCGTCKHCDIRYGEDSGCSIKQVPVSTEALYKNENCDVWKPMIFEEFD
jgi:hypothetical protein